jgi:hypothetical protein
MIETITEAMSAASEITCPRMVFKVLPDPLRLAVYPDATVMCNLIPTRVVPFTFRWANLSFHLPIEELRFLAIAYKLAAIAEDHERSERFRFRGTPIFNHHFCWGLKEVDVNAAAYYMDLFDEPSLHGTSLGDPLELRERLYRREVKMQGGGDGS